MTQISEINMNKTFSKSPDTSNFQTENMKHKIRAVHKNKKRKNFKNIETLENINEPIVATDKSEKIIEGLDVLPIAKFDESDWTEGDNIYEGGRPSAPTKKFSATETVNYIFDQIDLGITKIAKAIVHISTLPGIAKNTTDAENDTRVVRKYVVWGIALAIATISVYNWAFLMLYKVGGERVPLFDISRERLQTAGYTNRIYALIEFFLDIPIIFPEKIQEYFVKTWPDLIISYTHVAGFFALLFTLLTRFFYTASMSIRTMLIDILSVNMSNKILSLMYASTFLLYVLSFFEIKPISTAISLISLYAGFPASLLRPIFSNIIKLFFLVMFAVPIASSMCFLYLFIFSFFSIILLGQDGIFGVSTTIEKIKQYVKAKRLPVKEDTICDPLTTFDRIINILYRFLNFISVNIINVGYIVMLVYGIIDYVKHIKNPPLKVLLMIINIMAIVFFGYSAKESYSKADPREEAPSDPPKRKDVGFEDSLRADLDIASGYMQGIYNELPDISKLKEQIPSLDAIKQNIPSLDAIKQNIPSLDAIKQNIPSLDAIKQNIPNIETIKQKIPDLRSVVANVQPNTDTAQQINAALTDEKKLDISFAKDKPPAPSASSVTPAP